MSRLRKAVVALPTLALAAASSASAQGFDERADLPGFTYSPPARRVAEIGVPIHPSVAPSPDGSFFAALQTRPDAVLWIVPADGGEPFAFRKIWAAYKPRWAPSGNRIGFIAAIGPPRIWTVEVDPESGRPVDPPRMLYRTAANAFAFSPDGQRIAFVPRRSTAAGASEIHIIEWKSRRVRRLLRESGTIYRLDWGSDDYIYYGVLPSAAGGDSIHRVMRARVADGRATSVLRAREFLGLSSDGGYMLYRPQGLDATRSNVVELAATTGEFWTRLAVPPGPAPRWGAGPGSLIQVRSTERGNAIWAIPVCPVCYLVAR